jgi:DNA-nicking Smr family endonuclease
MTNRYSRNYAAHTMSHDAHEKDDVDFRAVLPDVRPIKQDRVAPHRRRRKPVPEQKRLDERAVMDSLLASEIDATEIETGEELLFARAGIQHSVMRKLRRGEYVIEAQLDLHGQTVAQARASVGHFLHECKTLGRRCVRIIHGKGRGSEGRLPVLKGKVNVWLRRRDEVLAFCPAKPTDGGAGAVYVLLKKN